MKPTRWMLLAALVVPIAVAAQTTPKTPPPGTPPRPDATPRVPAGTRGITGTVFVGESAPGFTLTSAAERSVKLSYFRGNRVLLAFAERRETFVEFRALTDSLLASGVVLIGISKDSPRSLRSLAERDSLTLDLLSDPTGEIAALYGSYDYGTARIRPGYILVGSEGIVRMVLLGQKLPADDLLRITRYALTTL